MLHKEFDVESNQVSSKDDISKGTSISTDDPHHKPEESPLPPHSDASNGKLTILISSGVFERVQKANQNAALQMINDMDIPHTLIDGMHLPQQDR